MKAHYYTNLVEGGRTTQGDALIKENALNEVARFLEYFCSEKQLLCSEKLLLFRRIYDAVQEMQLCSLLTFLSLSLGIANLYSTSFS